MCSISDIPFVGAVVNHSSEAAAGAVYRGIRYILFYKDNVAKLKSEIEDLDTKEQEIERQVEQDKNNGKTIRDHVPKWQDKVKEIKDEVTEFLEKYEGRTSWRCFNVLRCPNPYRRFQLGRWAAKKTTTVSELSDLEKKQLAGEIADFPPEDYSPISSTEYQKFGSREVAYEKILKALNCKEDGFPVVGVFGFGGVGKTRMMEEACNEVKAREIFNTVARANVGQVVDIGKIQDQLATNLNITEKSGNRTSQLKARLSKGDTILVILDDVWSEIPFLEIGIPLGDSSIKGCKILLTSRLQKVCIENKCKDPVEIKALTEDEAWGMFTKTVGISTIESVDDSLARQVCKKCARLPLIIAAVGKALHGKLEFYWKDAHNQLMNCKPKKIKGIPPDAYDCLRWSFDVLEKDAYLCLLLCSLAGEDEEIRIEFLFRLATGSRLLRDWSTLDAARNRVNIMVSVLKSSSLLLEGRHYNSVKLHDIIRDVARYTLEEESEYKFLSESNCHSLRDKEDILSSQKLIYLDFKSDNVSFPDDLVCPDLHTLYLKCSNLSGVQPPDNFFKSFPKLKYLLLDIKSLSAMPSSIQNLESLRSLTIHRCNVNDISHIIQLKNLEMLSLEDSSFGGMLLDLRQLSRLRMLDLLWCTEIMGIVLSGLVCLEELYLPKDCNILDEETKRKIPLSSVSTKFTSLKIYFEDVKSCPDEIFCKNLCRYDIHVGGGVKNHDSAMKSVYLCNDSIGGGVKTLVERGEGVTLKRVMGLQKCFSQGGEAFTDLKCLTIRECIGDEYLSRIHRQPHQHVGSFSKLSELDISNSGFKYLFCNSTARYLQQLEVLKISGCKMMEEIVRNEGQINEIIDFPKLRKLDLTKLPVFKNLFCGKVVFLALEELIISDLDNITEIWEEHGHLKEESFGQLKHLKVSCCHKLKNVIPYVMRQRLQNLEGLQIADCKMMEEIVRNEGQINQIMDFPKLRDLRLHFLPMFKSLFCGKVSFPSLEILSIKGVKINLEQIHLGRDYTSKLRVVDVGSESEAPQLIPPNWLLASRDHLEVLVLTNCYFHEWDLFSLLGNSSWKNNPYGTSISFRILWRVVIVNSCRLSTIFTCSVAKGLQKLEFLAVKSCGSIEEIVTDERRNDQLVVDACEEISFPKLTTIILVDLPNLKSFCPSANYCFKMPSLERVKITRCPQMLSFSPQQISSREVSFPSLEDLIIKDVKINLEQIHLGRDYTSKLRQVVVESQAPQLIPPNWLLASRDHLQDLELSNCNFHEWDLFSLLGNSSWKNNPYGTISFRILRSVYVNSCRLSTIFTCSVAKGLQELRRLAVTSCGSIEEIVTDERRNDQLVVDTCEEISFPKLISIELVDLPNLKSFCPSANYCFKMPSLEEVKITRCPQMLSFTPQQISTPEVKIHVSITYPSLVGEGNPAFVGTTTDINSYLHQIMNTQELFVDKKEEMKPNHVDKGKSIVSG